MAKATMRFNLKDPEDERAHLRCVKAPDMAQALADIDAFVRNCPEFERVSRHLFNTLEAFDIDIYALID